MRKVLLLITLLMVCGFSIAAQDAVDEAKKLIKDGKVECAIVNGNKIVAQERGHGVSPLLVIYDAHRQAMRGATVVDKVIGRAAAMIAISGKVAHVHGELMSEDAVDDITSSYTKLVPRILNKKMDGLCPLEQSVLGITDPSEALKALRAKIASFKTPKK